MPERAPTRFENSGDANIVKYGLNRPEKAKKQLSPGDETGRNGPQSKKRKRDGKAYTAIQSLEQRPATKTAHQQRDSPRKTSTELPKQILDGPSVRPNSRPSNPNRSLNVRRLALLETRKKLPTWAEQDTIRQGLRNSDVLVLSGETGSGKSTQVPQFLLQEQWCTGRIAITQPRRVAAISLARRVAEELGTPLGSSSPASKVGYSVRFDNSASPSTRIKYLTEGMLLQEMLRDAALKEYSAVIVDEVHERSVNVDLILGFLRNLVTSKREERRGRPLKVVVMSATADTQKLVSFFETGFHENHDAQNSKLSCRGTVEHSDELVTDECQDAEKGCDGFESESSWSGVSSCSAEKQEINGTLKGSHSSRNQVGCSAAQSDANHFPHSKLGEHQRSDALQKDVQSKFVSICSVKGRQYPVETFYLPESTEDILEEAVKAIFRIHHKEPLPGDILVFLTGQDAIENLERQICDLATALEVEVPKILVLPLFAALPQVTQQQIFQPAPPRTRKIILSTNIAETSVTVPGIRHVVDCGKAKVKNFYSKIGLDALLAKPISQSSAIQRQGRAGREAPGKCYRLYTEAEYLNLEKTGRPEILRCDLSQSILIMQARGIQQVFTFPLPDPPPEMAMKKSLMHLHQLGALDDRFRINDIGAKMAKLPLTPAMGRIIVEAAKSEMDCLPEILDILAALSVENVLIDPTADDKREAAEEARRDLFRREGDHLRLLVTVRGYASERADRRQWAESRWVSHRAMQNVMNVRKQLHAQCKQLGFLPASASILMDSESFPALTGARIEAVTKCLVQGYSSNVAYLMPDGSYRTVERQTVAIHPSSVLFGRRVEAIVFSEFLYTTKAYARNVSAIRMAWVGDML